MSVTVGVEPNTLILEPGSRATVSVGVTNASDVVEHYETTMLGLPFGVSASSEPPTTKLRPGEQGVIKMTVELSKKPPPAATSTVLGVLVTSPYRQQVSRCEELRLQVTPISGLTAKALPEVANGARASYRMEISNPGNSPVLVALRGEDAERVTDLRFDPYELYITPGATAAAMVTAAARRPWTGSPARRDLVFTAAAADVEATASVMLMQKPRIPSAVLRLFGVAGGLGLMAVAMFGAARMATNMLNQGASQRDTKNTTIAAEASKESAQQALKAAEENRKASEAVAAASLSAVAASASGQEKAAAQSSLAALASESKAADAAAASSSQALEASAASMSAAQSSSAAASASSESAAIASSAAAAAASSSAAVAASQSFAAVVPTPVDLTLPPTGKADSYTGPIQPTAFTPLTITAMTGQVTGCNSSTVSREFRTDIGNFLAPGTIDPATGNGQCSNMPVRIQFATPQREVIVTVRAMGLSADGASLSTGPLNYSMVAEGAAGTIQQTATSGTFAQLKITAPGNAALITAVQVRPAASGTDRPLMILQSVSYK